MTLTHHKKLNLPNYAALGSVGAVAAAVVISRSSLSQEFVESPRTTPPPTQSKPMIKEDTSEGASPLTTKPLTSPLHMPVGEHVALPLPLVHEMQQKDGEEEEEEGC